MGDESAFPIVANLAMDPRIEQGGLSKRELFAMSAMQGVLTTRTQFLNAPVSPHGCAKAAVDYADALINELAKREGGAE